MNLLRTGDGATLEAMQQATGWQAHSVRGFLSGTVKKRMALSLTSERGDDGIRRYRVADVATRHGSEGIGAAMRAGAKLERQIAALGDLSRDELAALWEKAVWLRSQGHQARPAGAVCRLAPAGEAAGWLVACPQGGWLKAAEKDYLARHDARRSMIKDSSLDVAGSGEGSQQSAVA